jgi:hypothetical protein
VKEKVKPMWIGSMPDGINLTHVPVAGSITIEGNLFYLIKE